MFDQGRCSEALDVFQGMLRMSPGDYEVLINIALCSEQLGDLAAAERYYHKAHEASPRGTDTSTR